MKVKFIPFQPHCFAFGGFEIQTLNNFKAIRDHGIEVSKLDQWDRSNDFEIAHIWGLGLSQYENINWAKKAGKKVVASILLYDYETITKKVKFKISSLIHTQRYLIEMLNKVDAVSVVNESQAITCYELYRVPREKIWVIPNVVDDKYFSYDHNEETGSIAFDHVLTVGNVCPRKNQLLLALACIKANIDLVIVGKVLEGDEAYGNELEKLVDQNKNIVWIKGLKESSDELYDRYKKCSLVALPSYVEQQPLSLLEGAVMGKPLLTANRTYGKQKLYSNACLVDPSSITSIINGLTAVKSDQNKFKQPISEMDECRAKNVAVRYEELYNSLIF